MNGMYKPLFGTFSVWAKDSVRRQNVAAATFSHRLLYSPVTTHWLILSYKMLALKISSAVHTWPWKCWILWSEKSTRKSSGKIRGLAAVLIHLQNTVCISIENIFSCSYMPDLESVKYLENTQEKVVGRYVHLQETRRRISQKHTSYGLVTCEIVKSSSKPYHYCC